MSTEFDVRHPGRREATVAGAAAAILLLVSWLVDQSKAADAPGDAALLSASGGVVDLDVSGKLTAQQIAQCLTPAFARSADEVTVRYGQVQRSAAGDVAVMLLRNDAGDLRFCDSFGPDSPSRAPLPTASAHKPMRYLTNGHRAWDCDGTRLDGFKASVWLSVSGKVAHAQLRFVVDGQQGPWFRASPQHGLVHVHGWLGQQEAAAVVGLRLQALDPRGEVLAQRTMPVPACSGGDARLG